MPEQALYLVLGFTIDFHRVWRGSSSSTWYVGSKLGDMECVMDTHKPALQVQLVSSLANTLKDLKRSHKALT